VSEHLLCTVTNVLKISDGLVTIRSPVPSDIPLIIAARDDEYRRWLGPGSNHPDPTACIIVERETVGWVDYDRDPEHDWLESDEVNLGYAVFPAHRGKGFATRAVELLVAHIAIATAFRTVSVLINPQNDQSLAVAGRCGFKLVGPRKGGQLYFRRCVQ
jgi:RimJ/RimL family protein N-acetyltransferase